MNTSNCEIAECCICLEEIGKTNNCTTACGHSFCLQCLMKSLSRNTSCPMCRAAVIEDEDDLGSQDSDTDEDDNDEDDEDDEDDDNHATSDLIAARFQEKGYTMADLISVYICRYKRDDPEKQTDDFIKKVCNDFDEIIENTDNEIEQLQIDRENMMEEDDRSIQYSSISLLEEITQASENNIIYLG